MTQHSGHIPGVVGVTFEVRILSPKPESGVQRATHACILLKILWGERKFSFVAHTEASLLPLPLSQTASVAPVSTHCVSQCIDP